jgi:hypothetical protein
MAKLPAASFLAFSGSRVIMPEKQVRPRSGAKTIAIDNHAQLTKIRLLLFLAILLAAGLALTLYFVFGR